MKDVVIKDNLEGLFMIVNTRNILKKNYSFKLYTTLILFVLISIFTSAAIDLNDPMQTGGKSPITTPISSSGYIEGTVYSSSGQPLSNGKVYIYVGSSIYQAYSDFQGYFRLNLPFEKLPNMVIIQVEAEGFIPENQVFYTNSITQNKHSFRLAPLSSNFLLIDPRLHHLGDDFYTGLANSQFQLPTEGPKYQTNFNLPIAPGQIERATLYITVKGAESNNPVEINGKRVGYLRLNNNFGNSGQWKVDIPTNVLRSGSNTLTISSQFDNDYDDFEFSNIYLELTTKQISKPPIIEVHEPLDGAQLITYETPAKIGLRATVSSDANISQIIVNGKTLGGIWGRYAGINETLYLSPGLNSITIEATDTYGQTTRKTLSVTVVGYPSFSSNLSELFSVSSINEHQNALRYLQNSPRDKTVLIYYPMWGEKNFHSSFVEKYHFLDPNRIDLPTVFANGKSKITNFNSFPSYFPINSPQIIVSYRDTSSYSRINGRLNLDYIPSNIGRELFITVTLAESVGYTNNYLEAREVFNYTLSRSYQSSPRSLDIPVNFSTNKKSDYRYVVAIYDSVTKELLYCNVF